jgi:hypothetical protein
LTIAAAVCVTEGPDSKINLESAVFLFHMSGVKPESSGSSEPRVL